MDLLFNINIVVYILVYFTQFFFLPGKLGEIRKLTSVFCSKNTIKKMAVFFWGAKSRTKKRG
jgi:hypothetical protein